MPTKEELYEQLYSRYRPALTGKQKSAAEDAEIAVSEAMASGDQAEFDAAIRKMTDLHRSWAVRAAQDRLRGLHNTWSEDAVLEKNDAIPVEEDLYLRFPGVDPRGKYCAVDMAFAERKERIKATLQTRSPEAAKRITDLMESEGFRKLEKALEGDMINYRRYMLAEKLCHSTDGAQACRDNAQAYLAREARTNMEDALTGIEYLLGMRDGSLPESTRRVMSSLGQTLEAKDLAECRAFVRPQQPSVDYPDYDVQLKQMWFSKPENWDKKLSDFSVASLTSKELGKHAYHYARGAADRTLSALFGHAEHLERKKFKEYDEPRCIIDRADHIIINGRTPREIMVEEYNANRGGIKEEYRNFNAYFIAKGHERTAELVGAALTKDERVEVFIPDEHGCIRTDDQPWRLTTKGFERKNLAPVTLNIWERFWNHFGYYQEKAAQAAQDAQFVAARARVRDYNAVARMQAFSEDSQNFRDQYFGDWLKDPENRRKYHGELPESGQFSEFNTRGYSFKRSAWPAFATVQLLMDIDASQLLDNPDIPKDTTFRDVLDPDKLRSARQKAGQKVIELFGKNDPEKEAAFFRTADVVLRKQIDRMMQGIDFTDPAVYTSPEMLSLSQMLDVAFDMSQETDHIKPTYNRQMNEAATALAKDAEPKNYAAELSERFGAATDVGRFTYYQMMQAKCALLSGEFDLDGSTEIIKYFQGVMTVQHYAALAKKNPGKPLTELSMSVSPIDPDDPNSLSLPEWQKVPVLVAQLQGDNVFQRLTARFEHMPEVRARFMEALSSGRLMKECSFQLKGTPPKLEAKMPEELFPPLPPEILPKLNPAQKAAEEAAAPVTADAPGKNAGAEPKPAATAKPKSAKKAPTGPRLP